MTSCAVVIVNYNAGALLTEAVRSVAESGAAEIVVVDNNSRDDSIAMLSGASAGWPLSIIRNGENLGFAAGCNIGFSATRAAAVLFINPDCRLEPGSLQTLIAVLEANPDAGIAGPLLLNTDGTEQQGGRNLMPTPLSGFAKAFGLTFLGGPFRNFNLNGTPLPPGPAPVEAISGGCMLVRREAMEQIGLWDQGYFLYCEDLDLCMRMGCAGWTMLFVPAARAVHVRRVSARSRPIFAEWHKHKGMVRFNRKFFAGRYPAPAMWIVEAGIWFHFGILAAKYQVQGWIVRLRGAAA